MFAVVFAGGVWVFQPDVVLRPGMADGGPREGSHKPRRLPVLPRSGTHNTALGRSWYIYWSDIIEENYILVSMWTFWVFWWPQMKVKVILWCRTPSPPLLWYTQHRPGALLICSLKWYHWRKLNTCQHVNLLGILMAHNVRSMSHFGVENKFYGQDKFKGGKRVLATHFWVLL